MKAIVEKHLERLKPDEVFEISDESHHHLSVVMRTQINDEIILLNGEGKRVRAIVENITKKKTFVLIKNIEQFEDHRLYSLGIGLVKRDYFEDILRFATELNIKTIIPIRSEYAQKFEINEDRVTKIINSSAVQSNALYFPKLASPVSWEELSQLELGETYYFHNGGDQNSLKLKLNKQSHATCLIGPEGGWSNDDLVALSALKMSHCIHMKSFNILKAITAVPTALGYLESLRQN